MRRRMFVAAGMALLAGCTAVGPPDFSFGGAGFQPGNGRLNLAYAERNLGNLGLFRGKPAEAAAALAQFEAAVAGIRNPAYQIAITSTEASLLAAAVRQERAALGIPLEIPPQDVAAALGAAVDPLLQNDRAAIRQALSNPFFTLGPDETLARLTNLPPLRDIESVAPLMSRSAESVYGGGFRFRR